MQSKAKQTKSQLIAELQRKVSELQAQSILSQSQAHNALETMGHNKLMGSCCIITIETLGGRFKIDPFAVNDGLSNETITAIKADIKRSLDLTINHPINKLK